jgi:branched-chain amino acid transport system permease protein
MVYVVSAAIAGIAGALWVQVQGNVTTEVYAFELSGDVLIMLILGGTGRLYGAFLGATVFKILENVTEQILGTDQPYWQLAVGLVLILTVLFARRGLFGIFEDLGNKWKERGQ